MSTPETSGTDTLKSAAGDLRRDIENKAHDVRDAVGAEVRHRTEAAQSGMAAEITSVSRALRRASDELRSGSPQERTFASAAGALADLADTVRDKDLGEMAEDLSAFARRSPLAFLGGAALIGFAGVRMAKASQRARNEDDSATDEHRAPDRDTEVTAPQASAAGRPASQQGEPR